MLTDQASPVKWNLYCRQQSGGFRLRVFRTVLPLWAGIAGQGNDSPPAGQNILHETSLIWFS